MSEVVESRQKKLALVIPIQSTRYTHYLNAKTRSKRTVRIENTSGVFGSSTAVLGFPIVGIDSTTTNINFLPDRD